MRIIKSKISGSGKKTKGCNQLEVANIEEGQKV